ncbi:MAG: hypothetical protein RLZZ519_3329 [Bacteroidota bacterium]
MLFVSANYSSFVRQDAEFFAQHFELDRFQFGSRKRFAMLVWQIKLLIWLLRRIRKSSVVFIWFGDYHSFLPTLIAKLFGRKSILVIGGYDAAKLPEYNYGGHNSKLRSWMILKSCTWATRILPVSRFVDQELSKRIGHVGLDKRTIVYNGVDLSVFEEKKERATLREGVICVSIADSENRAKIKGLDLLMQVAAGMPDLEFTLIGVSEPLLGALNASKTNNLQILGKIGHHELLNHFERAKVVCQFSRFESFGMAVAEGMACGCIAVTTPGTGASEILDESCGIVTPGLKLEELVESIRQAMNLESRYSENARVRVRKSFSLEKRTTKLLSIVNE